MVWLDHARGRVSGVVEGVEWHELVCDPCRIMPYIMLCHAGTCRIGAHDMSDAFVAREYRMDVPCA